MIQPFKNGDKKQGSALILTLLMLALMLTLVLYYVSLIRLETQVSGFTSAQSYSRAALNEAIAEALGELERHHQLRADERRASVAVSTYPELRSAGAGGALTGGVRLVELERLGWPAPADILAFTTNASWVISGEEDEIHTAYAWAVIPLTGMLDPHALEGWNAAHLGFMDTFPNDRVYFSAAEFRESHPGGAPLFLPGTYAQDRGWFDYVSSTWQTNVTVRTGTLGMNPLEWNDADSLALFERLYPDRDFARIHQAFLDFKEGRTLPSDPDGITAVPVPMLNEVSASMTVENLGDDWVEIVHYLDLEVWYPFQGNVNSNRYRVAMTPALKSASPDLAIAPVASDEKWTFEVPGGEPESAFTLLTLTTGALRVSRPAGQVLEVYWDLDRLELEEVGQGVADRLPAGLKLDMPAVSVPASGSVVRVEATIEVKDPVLNYDAAHWVKSDTSSLLDINGAARTAEGAEIKSDGWLRWTPAGRPGEWQAGWIGFLPLDTPWRSVDLFAEEGQWWFRHTRPPEWEPGKWHRDRVNPNSMLQEALAAVFLDLPKEKWPGEPSPETVELSEARLLGADLAAALELDEGADQRGDWTDAMQFTLLDGDADRHLAESVLANSSDRMAIGYQLYGLLVWSETRYPNGRSRTRHRENVILWVDPYPNGEGRHAVMKLFRSPLR
ncbi:hypothetical protein P0Y35_12850 [Kiritimatiellaeota bacterium B1221]|nr:hypothetical protein [Kiritimatiellaeota bacterium B1221]